MHVIPHKVEKFNKILLHIILHMKLLPHTAIYIIAKVRQRKGINPTANNYLIIIVVIMIVIIIIPALSTSIIAL